MPIEPELADALVRIGKRRQADREEQARLIRRAYAQGGGVREIARLTNLSHTHVSRIVEGNDSPERD